jgi:nucleoside-diphosphate-sugar epimerase
MKVLIIGGTGFIGRRVTDRLFQHGHEVSVFSRGTIDPNLDPAIQHIYGDRENLSEYRSIFEQIAPDVVVDAIAMTEADARQTMTTFAGISQRLVVLSSQDVYRARDLLWGREMGELELLPLTEDSALRSQLYPYRDADLPQLKISPDYDKILVERVVMGSSNLPGTILRLPMVYGEGDYIHRFYPYIQRMDEQRLAIVLGSGYAQWRGSYGYVENVAAAIALAVTDDRATNRIYNVSERAVLSQAELIETIGQIIGWQGKVVVVSDDRLPAPSIPLNVRQDWVTDSSRIRQELGYSEPIPMHAALSHTIDWERVHPPETYFEPGLCDYATEDTILDSL